MVNKQGKMVTKRIHISAKERFNALATGYSTLTLLLTFIGTGGSVFFCLYLMNAMSVEGEDADVDFRLYAAPRKSWRPRPCFYCWTDTGFLDGDTLTNVVEVVAAEWVVQNTSTNFLLSGDRLGAHMRPGTLDNALKRQMQVFFLLIKAFHFIRPLYASPFGWLGVVIRSLNKQLTTNRIMTRTGTRDSCWRRY